MAEKIHPKYAEYIEAIKKGEGYSATPYKAQEGQMTIGYGHVIKPGEKFTKLTEKEAHDLAVKDFLPRIQALEKIISRPLPVEAYVPLAKLHFNTNLEPNNTIVKLINSGAPNDAIAKEWGKFIHYKDPKTGKYQVSKGLVNARQKEINMWNKAMSAAQTTARTGALQNELNQPQKKNTVNGSPLDVFQQLEALNGGLLGKPQPMPAILQELDKRPLPASMNPNYQKNRLGFTPNRDGQ